MKIVSVKIINLSDSIKINLDVSNEISTEVPAETETHKCAKYNFQNMKIEFYC